MTNRHDRPKKRFDLICTFLLRLLLLSGLTGVSSSVQAQRPLPQTIIFAELPATTLDASPLTLSARASSMLEVSFHSVTLNTCSVNRNLLTLIRTGVCRVIARQEGNERYRRAFGVMRYFMVRPGAGRKPVSGVLPGSGAGVLSGDKGNIGKPAVPPEITPKTSTIPPSTSPPATPPLIPPDMPLAKPVTNPITDDTSGSGAKEEFYAIVTDQNHTPRQLIDADDRVVWEWDGEPFGSTPPNTNPGGKGEIVFNLRFPGQYFDVETNLNQNYFRDYDPGTGRYIESDPPGFGGGINTYSYVSGNPVSFVDPYGLATYVTNRDISVLGTSARAWVNPLTHTFTFSANPDGSIAATYSWGNAANLQGWNLNQPEDIKAAQQALQNGDAQQVAPSLVDPYYRKAFDQLNDPANNHANGILTNNCKTETVKLNDLAWKLLSGGKWR